MARQIEIEYKTLLKKEDYQKVKKHYQFEASTFTKQTNLYFDTPQQSLQQKRWGLRIRQFETGGELTLKCPTAKKGLLEITDTLTSETVRALIAQQKILSTGEVAKQLQQAGIVLSDLTPIAALTTKRYERKLPIGLLALDHSWYHGKEDYELELEVFEEKQGKQDFLQLLAQLDLPFQPAENKIVRALKVK
ncbi:CYTH domain-containing protein [Enterococcus sp. LJL98]